VESAWQGLSRCSSSHLGGIQPSSEAEAACVGREHGEQRSGSSGRTNLHGNPLHIVDTSWGDPRGGQLKAEKILDVQEQFRQPRSPASSQEGFLQSQKLWARGFNLITCFI
jgi:hypothetical protein